MSAALSLSHDAEYENILNKLNSESPIPSYSTLESFFNFIHVHHIRCSDLIVQYGLITTRNYKSKLDTHIWDLYEKILISACDIGNDKISGEILQLLINEFGIDSIRINKLQAIRYESQGKYDEAYELYNNILSKDNSNISCIKRQIAIHKSKNQIESAIKLLNKYLKTFASDESAWIELALLYESQQQYELVSFCYEELILITPENYLYHCLLAESYYNSLKYDLARQYFAQSLELKPFNNLRALYGLIACLRNNKANASTNDKSAQLYHWSLDKLFKHYETYNPQYVNIIKDALDSGTNNSTTNNTITNTKEPAIIAS